MARPSRYTCVTGGAEGADHAWAQVCVNRRMKVHIKSFARHRTLAPDGAIVETLRADTLSLADMRLSIVADRLERRYPSRNIYVRNLLRRNYHIIRHPVQAVFAIGKLDQETGIVSGGTGWAVEIALQENCMAFVYDLGDRRWFVRNEEMAHFVAYPFLRPILPKCFAGVGSRDIPHFAKQEIQETVDYTLEVAGKVALQC